MTIDKIRRRKCIICQREFMIDKKTNPYKYEIFRQGNSRTCSPKCSKVFTRIAMHIRVIMKWKEKQNKKGEKGKW